MTSHPPAHCCTIGVKHEGEARGEMKKIGDIPAYYSYPKDRTTQYAVLILPDVIGHEFINAQLIADQFAANGYLTLMPDLFHGDAIPLNRPEGFDMQAWLAQHPAHTVDPVVDAAIEHLREMGVTKIGGVGYCFGGKYVARWLKKGKLDAGYTAHPSFVLAEEMGGIEGPLSIAAAETDQIFPAPKRHETEEILARLAPLPYQMTLYSGVEHGFAVRADPKDRRKRWAKEQAFLQAVAWFDEHVKA